jgi:Ca2+-transporting ATPase
MQWFNVLNIRAGDKSVFLYKSKINKVLIIGMMISFILTMLAFNTEFLRNVLQIHPISFIDWMYVILISSSILWLEEIRKWGQKTKLFLRK